MCLEGQDAGAAADGQLDEGNLLNSQDSGERVGDQVQVPGEAEAARPAAVPGGEGPPTPEAGDGEQEDEESVEQRLVRRRMAPGDPTAREREEHLLTEASIRGNGDHSTLRNKR